MNERQMYARPIQEIRRLVFHIPRPIKTSPREYCTQSYVLVSGPLRNRPKRGRIWFGQALINEMQFSGAEAPKWKLSCEQMRSDLKQVNARAPASAVVVFERRLCRIRWIVPSSGSKLSSSSSSPGQQPTRHGLFTLIYGTKKNTTKLVAI